MDVGPRSSSRLLLRLATLLCLLFPVSVVASAVQFCKSGQHPGDANDGVDFCVGVSLHRNASTDAHNAYITLTHTRPEKSAAGWTGIGIGRTMKGSLMFVVYGDPTSGEKPVLSIRTADGHDQPTLVAKDQMNGGDIRVMRADWLSETSPPGTVTSTVSLVCYSCTLWPDTSISATAAEQPWIWAWNKNQQFAAFSDDAHLEMHELRMDSGWGRFVVDMAQAETTGPDAPPMPVIVPGVPEHDDSENQSSPSKGTSGAISWHHVGMRIHGVLLATGFLLLLPVGVVAMRSGSPRSFKCHWVMQATGSTAIAVGMAVGLSLHPKINSIHQAGGLSIAGVLVLQAVLGWRHHMSFMRIRRRTWLSHAHIWVGRLVMSGGAINLVLGLGLADYSRLWMALVTGFILVEGVALAAWVRRRSAIAAKTEPEVQGEEEQLVPLQGEEYFVVAEDDDQESYSVRDSTEKDK
ncbi:integral membrane protein [Purpureocillium lavendulum]|uniref:Integral membrane protein n=1 Tax=Purpureocillium lavendulum TaxID=1247861 RepID=A0AB34FGW8_9HYPO|nr:integral membrane protein [Purpureocillium lavendulum]